MAKRSAVESEEEELPSLHPRTSERLIAHEESEKNVLGLMHSKRLPHALLLTGARGIGKATFAYRIARFLLAPQESGGGLFGEALPAESLQISASHPTFRKIAAGSHPDLLVLESDVIKVEEARTVGAFLSLTPAESGWRVVIIDSADNMNRNAANALLKILEEPPAQALLILISHNPGWLLPTIRSRCRTLRMGQLSETDFARVMLSIAPQTEPQQYPLWAELSGHSPGVALSLINQRADELYRQILATLAAPDTLKLHSFADGFARKEQQPQWLTFKTLLLWLLCRISAPSGSYKELFDGENALLGALRAAKPLDLWLELWEKAGRLLADTDRLYLDRKQAILTLLRSMANETS